MKRKRKPLGAFWTVKEFSQATGFSLNTLYRWRALGVGPVSTKRHGLIVYPNDVVFEFFKTDKATRQHRKREIDAEAQKRYDAQYDLDGKKRRN